MPSVHPSKSSADPTDTILVTDASGNIFNVPASALGGQSTGGYVAPPVDSNSSGEAGQYSWDADYFYICIAEDSWDRFPVSRAGWNTAMPDNAVILSSSTSTDGDELTIVFDRAMSKGAGYQDSDFNLDIIGGSTDIGLTYVSGSGTDTWVFSIATVIRKNETVNLDCYGRQDGVVDVDGNAILAVADMPVVNDSLENYADIIIWSGLDGVISGSVYTATPDDYPPSHTASVVGTPVLQTTTKRVGWSSLYRPKGINGLVYVLPEHVPLRIGVWHYATTSYSQHPFYLRSAIQSTNEIRFSIYYGTRLRLQSTLIPTPVDCIEDFPINTWRFFEIVFDPANRKVTILINGVVKIDYTHSAAFPTSNPINRLYLTEFNTNGPIDFNDNLIVTTDITRDLYSLALFETSPRI